MPRPAGSASHRAFVIIMIRPEDEMSRKVGESQSLPAPCALCCAQTKLAELTAVHRPELLSAVSRVFLRVHWVAVPQALRPRRANRRSRAPSEGTWRRWRRR
eukprot:COSAG01_NODE_1225_length_11135_cov_32.660750_14_plen_102_part_00